ncbi:MAG: PRC-barrel domain containing protein [Gammaproteobacteria bacterium]|nr:MAG: PRC-barrel domain containing protein [Gammaproteobacteria bacterium]
MNTTSAIHRTVKASEVISVSVQNPAGEDLGEIKEIILDKVGGQVRYLVLSYGGFLGIGDKLFALPWKAIHYDGDKDVFILNVDKERLKNAPGFDKDNWPDMADREWEQTIHEFYKTNPYWNE